MTFNSAQGGGERRAGLFSRRFGETAAPSEDWYVQDPVQPPEWFEADLHVVEADLRIVDADIRVPDERTRTAAEAFDPPAPPESATIPVGAAETIMEKPGAPGGSPTFPTPQQHALAVWELIAAPTPWGDPARCAACLASALCQAPQASPTWGIWSNWKGQNKKAPKEVLALELAGVGSQARFFLRGPLPLVASVYDTLSTGYQDIQRVTLDPETRSEKDPLAPQLGEGVSVAELHLARPAILPLKMAGLPPDPFTEVIQASTHSGTSIALRVVSQLLVTPAPPTWKQRNLALLEKQRALRATASAPKTGSGGQQMGLSIAFLLGIIILVLAARGLLLLLWFVVLPLLALLGSLGLLFAWRRWRLSWLLLRHEPEVTQKLSQELVQVCLRLYVLGPVHALQAREAALDRLINAYGAYAGVNRWKVGKRWQISDVTLAAFPLNQQAGEMALYGRAPRQAAERYQAMRHPGQAFPPLSWWQRLGITGAEDQARPVLSIGEVAALWHLPATEGQRPSFPMPEERGFPDSYERLR